MAALAAKFQALLPHLNERQRRLAIEAEARSLGHGGIKLVAAAAGVREGTVSRGVAELDAGPVPLGRVRRPGGGRKKASDLDLGLLPAAAGVGRARRTGRSDVAAAVDDLIDPEAGGAADPAGPPGDPGAQDQTRPTPGPARSCLGRQGLQLPKAIRAWLRREASLTPFPSGPTRFATGPVGTMEAARWQRRCVQLPRGRQCRGAAHASTDKDAHGSVRRHRRTSCGGATEAGSGWRALRRQRHDADGTAASLSVIPHARTSPSLHDPGSHAPASHLALARPCATQLSSGCTERASRPHLRGRHH